MKKDNYALLYFLLFSTISAFAQWTDQTDVNTMVSLASTSDMQAIGTSDGKTYVAFWHEVPAPVNYEMRLQLLDAQGNPLFGPGGKLVNNIVPMSTFTVIWSIAIDKDDNVYIGFNGSGAGNEAYVHKISPEGTQLWGDTGAHVGSGFDVKVLPLEGDSAIVSWLPGNQGVFQKFDPAGTPVWANPVTIDPLVTNHRTSAGEMAELSNGDFVILLHDRGGFSPSSTFGAQRYDGNGTPVWPTPVTLANISTVFNTRYSITQENDTIYLGYSAAQGLAFYSYLQRINPDGALPWGINGSAFTTDNTYYQRTTRIAHAPGSDFIWAISEYTTTSQGEIGEYIQKFDRQTGVRLLTDAAKEVFGIDDTHRSHRGDLQLIDDQPIFMISSGYNNGATPVELLATYLDGNGDFIWPEQTRPMATYADTKLRFAFTHPYNGQCVGVWTEQRSEIGESRAFAQNITTDACIPPGAGFDYMEDGQTFVFRTVTLNVDSIIWDFGDGITGAGAQVLHIYSESGTYQVCQTTFNECGSAVSCQEITVVVTGTTEPEAISKLTLFPNPSQGSISVKVNSNKTTAATYEVLNLQGHRLCTGSLTIHSGDQTIFLPLPDLESGTYLLKMQFYHEVINRPFVIIK